MHPCFLFIFYLIFVRAVCDKTRKNASTHTQLLSRCCRCFRRLFSGLAASDCRLAVLHSPFMATVVYRKKSTCSLQTICAPEVVPIRFPFSDLDIFPSVFTSFEQEHLCRPAGMLRTKVEVYRFLPTSAILRQQSSFPQYLTDSTAQ